MFKVRLNAISALATALFGSLLVCGVLSISPVYAEEDDKSDEEESDEEDSDDPNISRSDEDDVDSWSFEGEEVKKEEVKKTEVKKAELKAEPRRYGSSGNWYEVTVECMRCPSLLDQKLGVEDSLVMRQFFDFIQIDSGRSSGKFVYPSAGENRPLGVKDGGSRLLLWQYTVETGSRLTDTYAVLWDLRVKVGGGLLYGRRYEVQAWTDSAYSKWDRGYKANQSFLSVV